MHPSFSSQVSKLPRVGTTIFSVMSALARQHQAINLSQGFPDFDCDPELLRFCQEAMQRGQNQYAPMSGLPALREEIARLTEELYGAQYDPSDEITVTSGATEALFCAIMALVHPGDEVIMIDPAYDSYGPAIEMSGGKPVRIALRAPDYQIDWQAVRDQLSDRTRLLILNSPHNPTGKMLQEADLIQLQELAQAYPFYLLSDEVYEHIRFDEKAHLSICRYPALRARSLVVSSFGKSLHITGWKVGYCLAPPRLTAELRKVHQFVTFSTSTPFQAAIEQYLRTYPDRFLAVGSMYEQKRNHFLSLMEGSSFVPLSCEGTYFQMMDYSQISDLPDDQFAKWLTQEKGVACIPVSAFYEAPTADRVVRFCFAKRAETLDAACERLKGL